MRRLGVDYGRKRVGLALTDARGDFAYPLVVLPNDGKLLGRLKTICVTEAVGEIVLGESLNFRRRQNPIMRAVLKFKRQLENSLGLPVMFEDETLTTKEAGRFSNHD
ncbi:MAG: RuvX/YqgF family protein, partial [Patescibacteria group bacterium]